MAASSKRAARKHKREQRRNENFHRPTKKVDEIKPLEPMNESQRIFLRNLEEDVLCIGIGSAGTGKTALACFHAMNQLYRGQAEKIILTRPSVALDDAESPFLPGTEEEKILPWLRPAISALEKVSSKGAVECQMKLGNIETRALDYIRGCSFDYTIVIVDEAQQLTMGQLKALTTRIGVGSQIILCGDTKQVDRDFGDNQVPLERLVQMTKNYGVQDVSVVRFGWDDIVRSGFCKDMVMMFEKQGI